MPEGPHFDARDASTWAGGPCLDIVFYYVSERARDEAIADLRDGRFAPAAHDRPGGVEVLPHDSGEQPSTRVLLHLGGALPVISAIITAPSDTWSRSPLMTWSIYPPHARRLFDDDQWEDHARWGSERSVLAHRAILRLIQRMDHRGTVRCVTVEREDYGALMPARFAGVVLREELRDALNIRCWGGGYGGVSWQKLHRAIDGPRYIPFDAQSGFPSGDRLYYECCCCGEVIPSLPPASASCRCRNIRIDAERGRIAIDFAGQARLFADPPDATT